MLSVSWLTSTSSILTPSKELFILEISTLWQYPQIFPVVGVFRKQHVFFFLLLIFTIIIEKWIGYFLLETVHLLNQCV